GPARIVNLRSIHRSAANRPAAAASAPAQGKSAAKGTRDILTAESGSFIPAKVYERSTLPVGAEIRGPAIVEQPDRTTMIEPGWRAVVAADGALIITADASDKP